MSENSSQQALEHRRKIIRALGLRFVKDTLAAINNMQPVQALEIVNHLLGVVDFMEQYAATEDAGFYRTFWEGEEVLVAKWGRLAKPYKEQQFETYFDNISVLTRKEIITIEEYNAYPSAEEQCVSAEEMKAVADTARHALQIFRTNLLQEHPPTQEAMDALSKDPSAAERKSPEATQTDIRKGLGQREEDAEDEGGDKDKNFSKSRGRMALYYLVKASGGEPRANSPVSGLAKLAHLITGEKLTSLNNSNIYKFYLGMPDYKSAKGRLSDLRFIRPFFEDVAMSSVVKLIDEEIALIEAALSKH